MPFSKKKLVGATLLVVGLIASLIANEVGQHMADAGRPFLAMCLRGLKVLFELFVLAVATWIGMQPAPRTPLPGSPESLISSASASAATSASASASEKGQSAGVEGKENCGGGIVGGTPPILRTNEQAVAIISELLRLPSVSEEVKKDLTFVADSMRRETTWPGMSSKTPNIPTIEFPPKESCDWGGWEFNVFALSNPIVITGTWVFEERNLIEQLGLQKSSLTQFFYLCESGYNDVPYHSAYHAADVLYAVHMLLKQGPENILSPLEIFGAFIAAAIHDYGHIGYSNAYLETIAHPLDSIYSSTSTLEQYSLFAGLRLVKATQILDSNLGEKAVKIVRKLIISSVLATDLARQKDELTSISAHVDTVIQSQRTASSGGSADVPEQCREAIVKLMLKCADLSNGFRKYNINLAWGQRVRAEVERQAPPVPEASFKKGTASFLENVVKPGALMFHSMFPFPDCILNLEDNITKCKEAV